MAKELSKMKWHNSNQSPTQREEGGSHLQQSAGEKKKKSSLGSPKRKLKAVYIGLRKQTDLLFFCFFFFFPDPARLILQWEDRRPLCSTLLFHPSPGNLAQGHFFQDM
jgi:hypothetical protein